MSVRIGLGFSGFPFSGPEALWRWVDACEASTIDSLWLSERLVSAQPALEPFSALAAIAGRTRRLKFGVNASVLPLRDPLILAKECATIDYLSNGRLLTVFGVGADTAPEWQALGVRKGARGRRANEMLALLPGSGAEDNVSHDGEFFHYRDVTINPKPSQSPLPLWIGGSSDAAIERTARHGSGWIGGGAQSPAQIARVISAIKERAAELCRTIDADHFGAGFSYRFGSWDQPAVQRAASALAERLGPDVDPRSRLAIGGSEEIIELVRVFRAVGVTKFVLRPIAIDDADLLGQIQRLAAEVIPTVHQLP
ncbi:MAG: LLM class flavin-dependent oxidoreductase [Dehalococcoidia bacterium]|nr:LLM class flavin-dependent oxidoreductase [Dehalococcoidia bacterium]